MNEEKLQPEILPTEELPKADNLLLKLKEKKLVLLIFLVLVIVSLVLVSIFSSKSNQMTSGEKDSLTREPASVAHFTTEDYWYPSSEHSITFSFATMPDPVPKFIELNISFNPRVVNVKSINPGTIWTSSAMLTNKIDNDRGELTIGFGQGFSADFTGDDEIVTLEVVTKENIDDDDEAVFTIMPSSYYSASGLDKEPFNNSILTYDARIYIEEKD